MFFHFIELLTMDFLSTQLSWIWDENMSPSLNIENKCDEQLKEEHGCQHFIEKSKIFGSSLKMYKIHTHLKCKIIYKKNYTQLLKFDLKF